MPYIPGGGSSNQIEMRARYNAAQYAARAAGNRSLFRSNRREARSMGAWRGLRRAKAYVDADGVVGWGAYRRRRPVFRRAHRRTFRRRGNYVADIMSEAGGTMGGEYGPMGAAAGAWLGRQAAGLFRKSGRIVTGKGAYNMAAGNELMGGPQNAVTNAVPAIRNIGEGEIVIANREFIRDVTTTGSVFALLESLEINPGLAGTFPWLSQIAQQFQEYEIQGMMFHFVSTSGNLSTTQALGEVVFATRYNVRSNKPTNKQQMLINGFARSAVPSADIIHPIETSKTQTPLTHLYVRSGNVPDDQKHVYDFAVTDIATQGQSAAVTLGELWVTYQVGLFKPTFRDITPGGGNRWMLWAQNQPVTSITATEPFGALASLGAFGNLGCTLFDDTSSQRISFPKGTRGYFMLVMEWDQASSASTGTVHLSQSGMTPLHDVRLNFKFQQLSPIAAVSDNLFVNGTCNTGDAAEWSVISGTTIDRVVLQVLLRLDPALEIAGALPFLDVADGSLPDDAFTMTIMEVNQDMPKINPLNPAHSERDEVSVTL